MPSREFLDALGKWMIAFTHVYRQPMTEATVWVYRETLCDLSVDELDRGCREAIKQTRFTPTPAEIRECSRSEERVAALNSQQPEPAMSQADMREFLSKVRSDIPWMNEPRSMGPVLVVTDEMRERAEAKKKEALEKFK